MKKPTKPNRYNPRFLPMATQSMCDENMAKIVQEHVGYNCPVIIERDVEGKPDVCKIIETGEILFRSSNHSIFAVTLDQAFSEYCWKHGIIPF